MVGRKMSILSCGEPRQYPAVAANAATASATRLVTVEQAAADSTASGTVTAALYGRPHAYQRAASVIRTESVAAAVACESPERADLERVCCC